MEYNESKQNYNPGNGFIPLSRNLFNHPFWKQKRAFSYAEAWIDLIQKVRFEQKPGECIIKNELVIFHRGEFVVSHRLLSKNWGWSTWKVRRFLGLLCEESMINMRNADVTNTTIISLCNYDYYNTLPPAHNPQATRRPPNTNKDNKEKKGESSAPVQNEEFKKFIEWMHHNTPNCINRENFPVGITEKQFVELREKYSKTQITGILLRIENRRDLHGRYNNLYLTLSDWLRKEGEYGN